MNTHLKLSRKLVHRNASLSNIRRQIVGINTKVPVLGGGERNYIYLDNAASTPVITDVLDTVNRFMPWYSSVHRGSGFKSKLATQAYEEARQTIARFFGANSGEHIVIFGKNTTEAINKLSYRLGLQKTDVVLVGLTEHHSNDLPWRRMAKVCHIKSDKQGKLIEEDLDLLLEKHKGRVKLVAVTGGSNVTGYMPDIHKLATKAHRAGAQILVDCAQLAPHRKIDIKSLSDESHLDYISVSAHKMYAPFGTGALIGRRDTFEDGEPELCGGGTIDVVTEDMVKWTSPPDRDEAGSPNVVGAVAFAKAVQYLSDIGMTKVAKHEAELTTYTLDRLSRVGGIEIFGDSDPQTATGRLGVIPLNVLGAPHGLVAEILGAEWGIGVRDGCFCAHPYVTHLLGLNDQETIAFRDAMIGGDRSDIPGLVRISFGMYNTKSEVDVLIEALKNIVAGNYNGTYKQDSHTGDYSAVGWEPDLDKFYKI